MIMEQKIYIVGAHSRAQTLAVYLRDLYPDLRLVAYLVNDDETNPKYIEGVPVVHFDENTELDTEAVVYIGTRSVHHDRLSSILKNIGFTNIYPLTVELDRKLRNEYVERYFVSMKKTFIKLDELSSRDLCAAIYVAKSIHDKVLQQPYVLASYEREIQAGAALTEQRLEGVDTTDDVGDNISDKNEQFCELTVLYWIWKHAKEDIIGLAHYRRHFILPDDWVKRMWDNGIDVILPVPLYVLPNLGENYKKRHDPVDWEYMMQYMKLIDMQTHQKADEYFKSNLYSPCNMFIARKNVLEELCAWLFPILFEVVKNGGQKQDVYLNRYPGFISERLISFFFENNRNRFHIAYADKNFLS